MWGSVQLAFIALLFAPAPAAAADVLQAAPIVPGFEEPLIPTRAPSAPERAVLDATMVRYAQVPDDFTPFERYLSETIDSPWRAAIETNLGLAYYRTGRFTPAIAALEAAWRDGRSAGGAVKALIDRAIGELLRMHARLGHAERVAALLADVGDRPITGSASEAVAGAREALWLMRNDPGVAYLCGPMALRSLAAAVEASPQAIATLEAYRSGPRGVSLGEVAQLARKVGLPYRPVVRDRDAPIPVPSVVHWKLDHYAAIVDERDGHYLVRDPTFGAELWLERAAIDAEASGYFLVQNDAPVASRAASAAELARVRGMGNTTIFDKNANTNNDPKICRANTSSQPAMCAYGFHPLLVSLSLSDTPVGYAPPRGPAMFTTLTYSQREANQPAAPTYFNFGPKWTSNWLGYVVDNPRTPGANVSRLVAGGGGYDYVGYNKDTGTFTPETTDLSVLVRVGSETVRYERRLGNGAKEVYTESDKSAAFPRRFFLTELIDPAGNRALLSYDDKRRLTRVTDAIGQQTTFGYAHATNPLLVTSITDPFGRTAKLAYDAGGRLMQITDVIGITSSFTYDTGGFVTGLVTPYGITRFAYTEAGVYRTLEATDPMGFTEHVEFRHNAPGIAPVENIVPAGMIATQPYQNFRNTFYWDKLAYRDGAGDYSKAQLIHWFHKQAGVAARTIESIKPPLERRIWMANPGSTPAITGTYDVPSAIGRVLDDGTSQVTRMSYNERGNLTSRTDAAGRTTAFSYAPNGIDLLAVGQRLADGEVVTLAQYTYDTQHRPMSATNAAGQVARFEYNPYGQLIAATDALGHTTKYAYDERGYLLKIDNANGKTAARFTYDAFGRVATRTDAAGHTVALEYDALDRLTRMKYPDGTSEVYVWHWLDLESFTDRAGRKTSFEYDANRNNVTIVDPLGRRTVFSHYPNGALESITDPAGRKTTWLRDVQSRVVTKVWPDGSKRSYEYEAASGRIKSITDASGQVTNFAYTIDDRVKGLTYTNATVATADVHFTFDTDYPRIATMTDGTGTTRYSYGTVGAPGALALIEDDGPLEDDTIVYSYDTLGRVAERTLDGGQETWHYDSLSRVVAHASELGSFALGYAGETGQLASRGTGDQRVGTQWMHAPTAHDRKLIGIDHSAGRDYRLQRALSAPMERIEEIADGASRTILLGYDGSNRLTSADFTGRASYRYAFDAVDNPISVGEGATAVATAYSTLDQVTERGGVPFIYDPNGNLTDDGERTYRWDAANRLVAIGYKSAADRSTEIRYNGNGEWVAIIDKSASGTSETLFRWCGPVLCRASGAGSAVRYYPEGESRAGAKLYYARDHLRSVRDVLDIATAKSVAAFDYDPYGGPLGDAGSQSVDFGFAGMFHHRPSGLSLARYRAYDPRTGRWLSRDPLGAPGGTNPYRYTADPVTQRDPSGLEVVITLAGGGTITRNTAQEFADAVSKLGTGSIERIEIWGHANQNGQSFSMTEDDPNAIVSSTDGTRAFLVGPNKLLKDLASLLAGKLASNAGIDLYGCNVATGPGSIASVVAKIAQTPVTGCADYTTGPDDAHSGVMCGLGGTEAEMLCATDGTCVPVAGRPADPSLLKDWWMDHMYPPIQQLKAEVNAIIKIR